jgi:hypothetical protein
MPKVAYTKDNIEKCWCGKCPVQVASTCANDLYEEFKKSGNLPSPERLGGLYCSTGKTICTDVTFVNRCNCAACLVWSENNLISNHYCKLGSADQIGR